MSFKPTVIDCSKKYPEYIGRTFPTNRDIYTGFLKYRMKEHITETVQIIGLVKD